MMNKAENIRYMILKQCQKRSLTELCDAWEVTIDDFYAYLDSKDKLLGNTADDWMGMYHIAADRADKAEAESEQLNKTYRKFASSLESELTRLYKVVDAARGVFLGEGERLCSEFKDAMDTLRQALADLDEEGER